MKRKKVWSEGDRKEGERRGESERGREKKREEGERNEPGQLYMQIDKRLSQVKVGTLTVFFYRNG